MDFRVCALPISVVEIGLLVVAGLLAAGSATASQIFTVDPTSSSLTIVSATFENSPTRTYSTTVQPMPGSNFVRSLGGTVTADPVTGALESAELLVLGDDIMGDQIMIDRRGNSRDVGDIILMALGINLDTLGNAIFAAGMIDFDLALGSFRSSSTAPLSLIGVTTPAMNTGGSPSVTNSPGLIELDIPIAFLFDQITVIEGGTLSLELVGTIHATAVPEPSSGLLVAAGIVGLVLLGRDRRS